MIRLLLVDSHIYYRQALRQLCVINGGFNVVAEADNGEQAISLAHQFHVDVVLMDADSPDLNSLNIASQLTAEMPTIRVLLLTMFAATRLRGEAHQTGVEEVLSKNCDEGTLFAAIRAAYASISMLR